MSLLYSPVVQTPTPTTPLATDVNSNFDKKLKATEATYALLPTAKPVISSDSYEPTTQQQNENAPITAQQLDTLLYTKLDTLHKHQIKFIRYTALATLLTSTGIVGVFGSAAFF
ncbi:MAG: hypothetical protein ACKO34_06030 [Vampirovibrionales bacterium]